MNAKDLWPQTNGVIVMGPWPLADGMNAIGLRLQTNGVNVMGLWPLVNEMKAMGPMPASLCENAVGPRP